ncbi:MAG TPA: flavodoxin domain-containing protein [Acidimicrobiales bacterium]
MKAVVIYESLTGKTRHTAEVIGGELTRRGVEATVCNVTHVDLDALSAADIVLVGSWVDGIFVVGQKPGRASRLHGLPAMGGKKAVVFCTFAINPGKTIDKMTAIVEGRGAEVVGGMAIRRDDLDGGARDLVERLLDALAAT